MNAELKLPIFKQGDDLAQHLQDKKDTRAAMLAYAERMKTAASILEKLAEHGDRVAIEEADTHFILVSGPASLIRQLIDKGLLAPEMA
jgi:hypothetical protein